MEEIIIIKSPFIPLFQGGRMELTGTLTRSPKIIGCRFELFFQLGIMV